MTDEDVIRMAREARLFEKYQVFYATAPELARLAALVAAHERERCAMMFDAAIGTGKITSCKQAAAILRARHTLGDIQ